MKGKEECPDCHKLLGTRTRQCKYCRHIFSTTIKEVVNPDGTITYITKNIKRKKKFSFRKALANYKEVDISEHDYKKVYSKDMRIWEHILFPSYKIKYTPIVYGINFDSELSYGAYVAVCKDHCLDIGNNNGRFHTMFECMKRIEKWIKFYEVVKK